MMTEGEGSDPLTRRPDFQELVTHFENVAVWTSNETGFEYMSPGFEEIWGRPVEEVLTDANVVIESAHPEDREKVVAVFEDRDNHFEDGDSFDVEHRIVRPDGEVRWVEVRIIPLHDESGDFSEAVGITVDITDRKQRERKLERQNERLDRFAQIVSHDLRNPLTTATGYLELLEDEVDHSSLERIDQALTRMDEIITNMLLLARNGSSVDTTVAVDLEEIARQAWEMTETEESTFRVVGTPGEIMADPSHLRGLFENILRNAVDHAGNGAAVEIGELSETEGFYVADDGEGIPESERDAIFEGGYSSSSTGTGFGLLIVKEIVDAHGWDIRVTDSTEGGARFEIRDIQRAK